MERSPATGRITATAPAAPLPATPPAGRLAGSALALGPAVAAILVEITHPLLHGPALHAATVAAVLLAATACVLHATWAGGSDAAARLVVVAAGTGWAAEAVGVATGVPFGEYRYTGGLGPQLLGVPLVVPLAWTMTAYPCLALGRRLARRRPVQVALAAWTLAAWDLYLDPQMVAEGNWTWAHPAPALPGVPDVPVTNAVGWLLFATVITFLLDRALPDMTGPRRGDHQVPALLLGWTWLGSALGNLVFFDRPAVAAYGGVTMGATVLPYLWSVAVQRRS
ncbi:MAG TPA: carotenoid biosynthesis protein [Kineosporiaceae bacterium]